MTFDPDVRLGIGFIVLAGSMSFFCVTGIIFYTAVKRLYGREAYGPDASDSNLFLSLMVADLFHAIGIIFNMKWEAEGVVTEGAFCTAQAVLKQIGNNGVSFTSLAITAYTFCVLVLVWVPRQSTLWVIIFGIWFCTGLVVGVPNIVHRHDTYYGDTGFWCFIKSNYTVERLLTDYIWVWLAGLVMTILYSIMAVVVYRLGRGANQAEHIAVARKLMLYPIVYILCILPNTVARWMSFTHHAVPYRAILAGNSLHALFGFFNFVVFCATRPAMVFGIRRACQGPLNTIPLQTLHCASIDSEDPTSTKYSDDATQW